MFVQVIIEFCCQSSGFLYTLSLVLSLLHCVLPPSWASSHFSHGIRALLRERHRGDLLKEQLYENFHRGNLSICCVFVADLSSSTALYSPLLPPLPTPLCPLAAGGGGFYKGNLCCVFPALQRGVYRLFFSLFLRLIFFPYTVLVHHLQPVLSLEAYSVVIFSP